jgi:hypothetical protein
MTTTPELIIRMEKLAQEMRDVAVDLLEYSPENATDLSGAAAIMDEWVKHLREDCHPSKM